MSGLSRGRGGFFSFAIILFVHGNGFAFRLQYVNSHEVRWGYADIPVRFVVSSVGTPDTDSEFEAVKQAFQTWENVPNSNMTFIDGGRTDAKTIGNDGLNLIIWIEEGWPEDPAYAAMCYSYVDEETGHILGGDIILNGESFTWSTTGDVDSFDVQNVATHEIGHYIGLGDLDSLLDINKTMYGSGSKGETKKRSLHSDDEAGISYLYPSTVAHIGHDDPNRRLFKECYDRVVSFEGKSRLVLFGYARNYVHTWGDGLIQDFQQDGNSLAIMLANGSQTAYAIYGGIWDKYKTLAYLENASQRPPSYLGYPTSDEEEAVESGAEGFDTEGRVQDFQFGHLHWHRTGSRANETFETHGAIDGVYGSLGDSAGWLGFPISDEYKSSAGYARSDFEGGYITTLDGIIYQAFPYVNFNLSVTSINAPVSANLGEYIAVSWTVKNLGTAPSGAFCNRVSLSTQPYGTHLFLANFPMASIGPGLSSSDAQMVKIPETVPIGYYYVTVYADPFGTVLESDENNNINNANSQIHLVAAAIVNPVQDTIAPAVSIGFPAGANKLPAGSQQIIRWSATDDIGVDYIDLFYTTDGWASAARTIASGLPNSGSYAWTVPEVSTNQAAVRVAAYDEAGNDTSAYSGMLTIFIEVTYPDLVIANLSVDNNSPEPGQNIIVTTAIANHGDLPSDSANIKYYFSTETPGMPTWARTFGGNSDDWAESVQQTSDGGYIVLGSTESLGFGKHDLYLIKTDSRGKEEWSRTFGGIADDQGYCVQQTSDGGYILVGETESFGAGSTDAYLVKTDRLGNEEWSRTFGGEDSDTAQSVAQTLDGGYILAGSTLSFEAGPYRGAYLVKTDSAGDEQWSSLPGRGSGVVFAVKQTSDGGYILAGYSHGNEYDMYSVKTDAEGNTEWYRLYDGHGLNDVAQSVSESPDRGFVIAGYTCTYYGTYVYLVKTDSEGNEQWSRDFGPLRYNQAYDHVKTSDGGYIVAGFTHATTGPSQVYLIKTDTDGNSEWERTIVDEEDARAYSIKQTANDGYIVAGFKERGMGDDVYLIKTDSKGKVSPPGWEYYLGESSVGNIAVGSQAVVTKTVAIPSLAASEGNIVTVVNPDDLVQEKNFDNNTASMPIMVHLVDKDVPKINSLSVLGGEGPAHDRFKTGREYIVAYDVSDNMGIDTVDFFYSIDDGASWETIALGFVPGSNGLQRGYVWVIPGGAALSAVARVKMIARDTSGNVAVAMSDAFTIIDGSAPGVVVISPNGGEVWDLGSDQKIVWEASSPNGIVSLRIYYHYGDTVDHLATEAVNDGFYLWTIPMESGLASESGRIRIRALDANGNEAEDYSDYYFTIRDPSAPPPLPWTMPAAVTTVPPTNPPHPSKEHQMPRIAVDTNRGVHLIYLYIEDNSWEAPRIVTQQLIYVSRRGPIWLDPVGGPWSDPQVIYARTQETDGNLTGYRSISGLQTVVDGSGNLHIAWEEQEHVDGSLTDQNNREIHYLRGKGTSWASPINISANSTVSSHPRMARDLWNNLHIVWVDGLSWNADSTQNGYEQVYYRKRNSAGSWSEVEQLTDYAIHPDIAAYGWANLHFVFRSFKKIYHTQWDGSSWSNALEIAGEGDYSGLDLASDHEERPHLIWFNSIPEGDTLIPQVLYSCSDGITWSEPEEVSDRVPGSYPRALTTDSSNFSHVLWTEEADRPRIIYRCKGLSGWSNRVQISLDSQSPLSDSVAAAISEDDFLHVVWIDWQDGHQEVFYNYADVGDTMVPLVTLLTPSEGESLSIGSSYDITWSASDDNEALTVSLEYTLDNGASFKKIAEKLGNTESYQWTVPNVLSETVQLRITVLDAAGNQARSTSGCFSVSDQTAPIVLLKSPNGEEVWSAGEDYSIAWQASDNVGISSVDLLYSIDGGTNWTGIATGLSGSLPSYSWRLPGKPASTYLVKVVVFDAVGNQGEDSSDKAFTISATLDDRFPNLPTDPAPGDGTSNVAVDAVLEWTGGDPDVGDTVAYDVYFGRESTPALVSSQQQESFYSLGILEYATFYFWRVVATDSHGMSSVGPVWMFVTEAEQPPELPSNLLVSGIGPGQIDLSWQDSSNNETGFKVERKEEGGLYGQICILPAGAASFSDRGLREDRRYHYRVRAYNASGNSGYSNEVNAVPEALDTDADGIPDWQELAIGTNPNLPDTDNDKMPDGWEFENELDPLSDDAAADSDRDGRSNLSEYVSDTDPGDPVSFFCVDEIVQAEPSAVTFTWETAIGRLYTVQCCEELSAEETWTNVSGYDEMEGTGMPIICTTDYEARFIRFYRVKVILQP
jgi:hypothetical protein